VTSRGLSRTWIVAVVVFSWLPLSHLPGSEERSAASDIESARAAVLQLRAERALLRESLGSPSEDVLGGTTGSVTVEAEYRFSSDGDRDLDTYLWLWAEVGDDSRDPITGSFSGRLNWDLNGLGRRGGVIPAEGSAFADYNAIENERLTERVYTGYIDFNRAGPFDKIRFGRQFHGGYAGGHFDGAAFFASLWKETYLQVYGGVPVNYHELTGEDPFATDRIYGGAVTYHWTTDLSLFLDVQGVRDHTELYGTHNDYLAVLGFSYDFQSCLRASVIENLISGEQRDLSGSLVYWSSEHDFHASAHYFWMPRKQDDLAYQLTPFADALGALEPYQLLRLEAVKGIGGHFEVGAGVTRRELIDDSDESLSNNEYTQTRASFSVIELPIEDLDATISFEHWNTTNDDEFSLGGDIRQRLGRRHVLEAGSYYAKFKYRQLTLVDTLNVQTYFVRWRWAFARDLSFHLKGEVEDAEDVTYNTLSAAVTLRF